MQLSTGFHFYFVFFQLIWHVSLICGVGHLVWHFRKQSFCLHALLVA